MNNSAPLSAIGIPWFTRDDYEAFRRLMPTQRRWHATFDEWEEAANKLVEQQERSGVRVFKAKVQSDAFAQWCRDTGRNIDSQALLDYGNDFARRQLLQQQTH
jgi:hypothetical protein